MDGQAGSGRVKLTTPQIAGEVISILLLIGMFAYVAVRWNDLPELVPGHFNAEGEIDRWGNKIEILVMPVVLAVLFVFLTMVSYLPSRLNVPVKGEPMDRDEIFKDLRNLLVLLKVELAALFFFFTYHVATSQPLPIWYLPLFLAIVLGTTTIYVSLLIRKVLVDRIRAGRM